jgi:putative ABC transport system permease protein
MGKRRMSLADVRYLYRARLRRKTVLVQELFAILGIAVGVALLFASQVASTSLTRSVKELTSQLVGNTQEFQLDARGPDGFDERLLGEVQRLASVQVALPVLEQQASVIGPTGRRPVDLIGADPRFVRASGPLLRHFSAKLLADQRAIALPAPLAGAIGVRPLQPVKLQIGANVVETLLATTLEEADIGGLVHSPVVLAPVRYAQSLAGMQGRVTRIFLKPRPGHEREMHAQLTPIAAAAGVNLEPAGFDSTLFAVASGPQSQSETTFSVISALVGFMFALNAMLLTVPARRKLIEDLRPLGATRRINIQIMLLDALIIGVLACLLGLALGELLSVAVFHSTPGYLAFAFPVGNDRIITWQSVAIAVAAGMAAAGAGVLWPLRHILLRPLWSQPGPQAPSHNWSRIRLIASVLCLAITTLILVAHPQAAVFGNFTLIAALLLLLPSLFDWLVNAFERLQRPFNGASPRIAITNLRTERPRVRSLAITATAAVAVFGIVSIQGAQVNLERGLNASARGVDSSADVWVTADGHSNPDATVPFTDQTGTSSLAALPGVSRVGVYRGSFLNWGERRIWVLAPPRGFQSPIAPSQLISGNLALAAARIHQGGWAVLGQALASEYHLHIGQTFTLPSPHPTRLRVAALITNLGWPPGAIVMGSADYASAWGNTDTSAYLLQAKPGTTPIALRSVVQRALSSQAGLTVETYAEREHLHETFIRQGLSRLTQIRLLVLIAAILAVTGALAAMTWQRRDLVAFIRCEGYRKGVLWRWLLCESALLLTAGCSIGAVFGLYGQLLLSHALASVTGFPVVFQVGLLIALFSFALVSAMAIAIVAIAGYLVVRVRPRTASPAY